MIKFDRIYKTYTSSGFIPRKIEALRDFSLEIKAGETFGIIGPNGAGKTTAIKVLLGLIHPTSGSVHIGGKDAGDISCRIDTGYLPDQPYFYDYLTLQEFLDYCGKLTRLSSSVLKEKMEYLISLTGLSGKEHLQLRKFSRGMLQRAGLAQALLHDPGLLIFDEPLSGLDPVGRREFRDIIFDLKKAGKTIFFSSHILEDAEQVCDRVGILVNGTLKAIGKMEEITSRKVKRYEIVFHSDKTIFQKSKDLDISVLSHDGKYLIRTEDSDRINSLIGTILEKGGKLESVVPHKESLEDVFLETINRN